MWGFPTRNHTVSAPGRDLQRRTRHEGRASGGRRALVARSHETIERARDLADDPGRNLGIARGRIKLDVAERTRAIMLPFYVIESQSAAERDRLLVDNARRSARDKWHPLGARSAGARACESWRSLRQHLRVQLNHQRIGDSARNGSDVFEANTGGRRCPR